MSRASERIIGQATPVGEYRVCKGRMIRVLARRGDHITIPMLLVDDILALRSYWVSPSALSVETFGAMEVLAWVSK